MPGVPDQKLRARVRRACHRAENRGLSSGELARRLGCSRHTVTTCRRELIAAGLLPDEYGFKPGAAVRTGYVRGEYGESVRS